METNNAYHYNYMYSTKNIYNNDIQHVILLYLGYKPNSHVIQITKLKPKYKYITWEAFGILFSYKNRMLQLFD